MPVDRSQRVDAIYRAALALPLEEQAAFVANACAADEELSREVQSRLAAGVSTETFADAAGSGSLFGGSAATLVGASIGPYRVGGIIGRGGMGIVYKATDTRLNRAVAIKAIHPARIETALAARRLRSEALAAASLDHPYICKIYELVEHPEGPFIVMEFVEGETLATLLARGTLPATRTIEIGREIAEGLANAHARGLVHRDIKPSNVLVTGHGHIKLLDFGLAMVDVASASTTDTHVAPAATTALAGTPFYMAPEQAVGDIVTARADLFSLGVVLFECLAGTLPFAGTSRHEYLQHLIADESRPLGPLAPHAPEELVRLVEQCIRKAPAQRPESAGAIAAELERIDASLSGPAGALTQVDLARTRRRWQIATAVVVLAAAVAVFWPWRTTDFPGLPVGQRRPVQTWPSAEFESRVSPDGNTIAFLSNRDGHARIYVQATDGTDARELPLPEGAILSETWSADGRDLAYLIRQGAQVVLQTVNVVAGGAPGATVPIPQSLGARAHLLRWIGREVYFQTEHSGVTSLQRVDLDHGTLVDLSGSWPIDGTFRHFDVRPDGRRAAFVMSKGDQIDLWTANLDGTSANRLTNDPYMESNPIWRGAGGTILYQSSPAGLNDIWEISPDTRHARPLTSGPDEAVPESTSADGSVVTYQQHSENAKLWLWDASQGQDRQLTADALSDFSPALAGNGRAMAFQRSQLNPTQGSFLVDSLVLVAPISLSTMQPPQQVATGFAPSLSPDGSWVAYLAQPARSSRPSLILKRLDTAASVTVSTTCRLPAYSDFAASIVDRVFTWAPSGRSVYYVDNADAPMLRAYTIGSPAPGPPLVTGVNTGWISELYASADGSTITYLNYANGTVRLGFLSVASGATQEVAQWPGTSVDTLGRGWLADDSGVVIIRRQAGHDDFSADLDVLIMGRSGHTRRVGRVSRAFLATARLDSARDVLYVTRAEAGINNIFALSIRTGALTPVTHNTQPGVMFAGVAPLDGTHVVGARDERTQDVWLIDSRKPPR